MYLCLIIFFLRKLIWNYINVAKYVFALKQGAVANRNSIQGILMTVGLMTPVALFHKFTSKEIVIRIQSYVAVNPQLHDCNKDQSCSWKK